MYRLNSSGCAGWTNRSRAPSVARASPAVAVAGGGTTGARRAARGEWKGRRGRCQGCDGGQGQPCWSRGALVSAQRRSLGPRGQANAPSISHGKHRRSTCVTHDKEGPTGLHPNERGGFFSSAGPPRARAERREPPPGTGQQATGRPATPRPCPLLRHTGPSPDTVATKARPPRRMVPRLVSTPPSIPFPPLPRPCVASLVSRRRSQLVAGQPEAVASLPVPRATLPHTNRGIRGSRAHEQTRAAASGTQRSPRG